MTEFHQFVRVEFTRFKAFKAFKLELKHFNILVGPNNAGKSTVLAAFRILASALRRAIARKAAPILGPNGLTSGYQVDLATISVAEENIFYNYDEDEAASVAFFLSNGNSLTLHFPEQGRCILIPDANGRNFTNPTQFKLHFNCPIGFVPILGPVEHNEPLFEKEAARLALFNYRAARNFRNIWFHYREHFEEFREILRQTWPGMDIEPPEIDRSHGKPRIHMYCPENRIPRELFWSGFGFQVWCQMLTHIIQSKEVSLFLIDEPDIYLHAELQRQLLGLLRNLGPDILLAMHSTEIITEAEADDILVINKDRRTARRLRNPNDVGNLFELLGSNINPILTQLAKTRRALFVEGKDFQIISRFALKLNERGVANRSDFAVVPVEGFSPDRIRNLKIGMETTLGSDILAAAIFDRDFRSSDDCKAIITGCESICQFAVVHERKEIENYLLLPDALDRALQKRVNDRARRTDSKLEFSPISLKLLEAFANEKKSYTLGQLAFCAKQFKKGQSTTLHETEITAAVYDNFENVWATFTGRMSVIPGKDALTEINRRAQELYGVSVTPSAIIDAMNVTDVPPDLQSLVRKIASFSKMSTG